MIFQEANLLPWRNLMQNIHFPFEIKKIDPKPYEERIAWPARRGRPGRVRDQVPARALRRHAAARQHRALPLLRSRGDPDGRAVRRARCLHPRRDEPAHPEDLDGDRQDDRLRHPQRDRGDLPGRPGRRAVAAARAGWRTSSTSIFRGRARSSRRSRRSSSSSCSRSRVTIIRATAIAPSTDSRGQPADWQSELAGHDPDIRYQCQRRERRCQHLELVGSDARQLRQELARDPGHHRWWRSSSSAGSRSAIRSVQCQVVHRAHAQRDRLGAVPSLR